MIKRAKHRLSHVSPKTLRYKLARSAFKEKQLREAHACTFYWVYMPGAILFWVMVPIFNVLAWIISRPIAWLAGYKRIGPIIPMDPDVPDTAPCYENAHVKTAPWRIALPLVAVSCLAIALVLDPFLISITLGILLVAALIGWACWKHWATISTKWEKICPKLTVNQEA